MSIAEASGSTEAATELVVPADSLDPLVSALGLLVGLLKVQSNTEFQGNALLPGADRQSASERLELNTKWFADPLSKDSNSIRTITSNPQQIEQLLKLLEELLGSVSEDAVGITGVGGKNRKWYPIKNPVAKAGEDENTGLYLVTEGGTSGGDARGHNTRSDDDAKQATDSTVVGLGAMHSFDFEGVEIKPFIYVPLLVIPPSRGGNVFVLGDSGHPIQMGMEIGGLKFGTDDVSFEGVRVQALVKFTDDPFDLDVVLLNLKLPNQPAADKNINDLENTPVDEWISAAAYLLVSQIIKAAPSGKAELFQNMALGLLSVLGLIGEIPSVDWGRLVEKPDEADLTFSDWLTSIAGRPAVMKRWLQDLYSLLHGLSPNDDQAQITGTGTRDDPWLLGLLSTKEFPIELALSVAVRIDPKTKALSIFPGVRVASKEVAPLAQAPETTVRMQVSTEVVELTLPGVGKQPAPPQVFPSFSALAVLSNPTSAIAPESSGASSREALGAGAATLSVGSIRAGFEYRAAGAKKIKMLAPLERAPAGDDTLGIYPTFLLTNVQSPYGSWDVIDLTNFDELVKTGGDVLSKLVAEKLDEFFAERGDSDPAKMAASAAAMLGVKEPPEQSGWPVKLVLESTGVQSVIDNPLSALGAYWTRCLEAKIGEDAAWKKLLPNLAVLLGDVSAQGRAATGSGSLADPWQVELLSDSTDQPGVFLKSWKISDGVGSSGPQVALALAFRVPLPVSAVEMSFSLQADLLHLQLPTADAQGGVDAQWLPGVAGSFHVSGPPKSQKPQPLITPDLGGITISADSLEVSAGWARHREFFSAVSLNNVLLSSGGQPVDELGNLQFSFTPTSWDSSVLDKATRLVFDVAGSWLLQHGGAFGVSSVATLGLLPDLASVFNQRPTKGYPFRLPADFKLPDPWPQLKVQVPQSGSFFAHPWAAVRDQLLAIVGSSTNAPAWMQLLGWSITGNLPAPPDPLPAGTWEDPWWVEFDNFWQLRPLLWTTGTDSDAQIGFGVERLMLSKSADDVKLDVSIRADVAQFNVSAGRAEHVLEGKPWADQPQTLPRLSLACRIGNSTDGQPLIQNAQTGLEIGSVHIGVFAEESCIRPVVVLKGARLAGKGPLEDVDLQSALTPTKQKQILETLLGVAMEQLSAKSGKLPQLQSMLKLLAQINLVTYQANQYGINLGGWKSLLSEPGEFLVAQTQRVAASQVELKELLENLAQLIGFSSFVLPKSLDGLPAVLTALGLMESTPGGIVPRFSGWLELVKHPVGYLEAQGRQLLDPSNPKLRKALVSALQKLPPPSGPIANLPLSVQNGTLITLRIPDDKRVKIGDELVLDAGLVLNLQAFTLSANVSLASKTAGVVLNAASELNLASAKRNPSALESISASWGLGLGGIERPGVPAAFDPLVFYPLPSGEATAAYLKKLGKEVPILLVSSLGTQLLNHFVVGEARYAVILRILDGLGLTVPDAQAGAQRVQSLIPVFMHPVDWLLSDQGLGKDGGLDLDKIGKLLSKLPGEGISGPGNIRLEPDGKQGMKLSGLPLGAALTLDADSQSGVQLATSMTQQYSGISEEELVAAQIDVKPQIEIGAHLAFGTGSGVDVGGSIKPGLVFDPKGPTLLTIDSQYDSKQGFTLDIAGQLAGAAFPPSGTISLVPFKGLSQFAAGSTALLQYAASELIQLFDDYKQKHGDDPVVQRVSSLLDVAKFFEITSVDSLLSTFQQLADDPLAWLLSFFGDAKLAASLTQVNKLLTSDLGFKGISVDGTLLTYQPDFADSRGSLAVVLGQRDQRFGVWFDPTYEQGWLEVGAATGIGFQTPLKVGAPIEFNLGASMGLASSCLPKAMTGTPTLGFGLDVNTQSDPSFWVRFFPAGEGTTDSTLVVDLLPKPQFAYGDQPLEPVKPEEWIPKFTLQFLVPLVADIVLETKPVSGWLDAPLLAQQPKSPPPGKLLSDWTLLTLAEKGPPKIYALTPIDKMFTNAVGQRLSPTEVVELLFLVALEGLNGFKLIPIGQDGGIYVKTAEADSATDYGLRVQLPNLSVRKAKPGSGDIDVVVQLGAWLSSKTETGDNWIVSSDPALKQRVTDPGLVLYFIRNKSNSAALESDAFLAANQPKFHPQIELVSLGVDVGRVDKPLIDVKGFQVGSFEPRIYFSMDVDQVDAFQVGAAIQCQSIGLPLGPASLTGNSSNKNPVAENLLASGDDSSAGGQDKTSKNSVNPTFTTAIGYAYDNAGRGNSDLVFRIFNDDGSGGDQNFLWIPVQRSFGPLRCNKFGMGYEKPLLDVGFDGSVSLAGLSMGLVNLKVGVPITTPLDYSKYSLDLDGLDISYQGGPVEISGGFLKTTSHGTLVYNGLAKIQAGKYGLTAVGSYGLIGQDTPSMFVFALLSVPLGDPTGTGGFFITGVAAGFGFNRNLQVPEKAEGIAGFPFVAGVLTPGYFDGENAEKALQRISDVSQPQRGQYWIAAGIQFTSWEMLNSFALLTASFGTEFELALIGMSVIELPIAVKGGGSYTPIARAELLLLVAFRPSQGLLAVSAALSKNSYVLDKACHLTGGFAFYVWFAPNKNAGGFVVTLGGYHPSFKPPDGYPQEPRLGFNWLMPEYHVVIKGGCYFALTPTAVMAGGSLQLMYHDGNLRAWFEAWANFLIQWKPFHYEISIGVRIGASYRMKVWFVEKTFTIELGASIDLWGPPTGGKAHISWFIISFTVYFGPGNAKKPLLDWGQFNDSFLPKGASGSQQRLTATGSQRDPRIEASVAKGLVKAESDQSTGEVTRWVIDPQTFRIVTGAAVPATDVQLNNTQVTEALVPKVRRRNARPMLASVANEVSTDLGIVPVGGQNLNSTHGVSVKRHNETTRLLETVDGSQFRTAAITKDMPRGLWNPSAPDRKQQLGPDQTIPNVMVGMQLLPRIIQYNSTLPVPMSRLQFAAPGKSPLVWGDIQPPRQPQYPQKDGVEVVQKTIMKTEASDDVVARRAALLNAVASHVPINPQVNVSVLAHTADQIFLANPVLAPLGGVVNPTVS